ncbi:MAG: ScpA family protein [Pseudomonadota bacterium]
MSESVSIDALTDEADDASGADVFVVNTEGYEGPLHLLLDLARRQKVDLLKISVLALATQYLDFIQQAKSQRIDLAADYLLMAAWLAYLKSRLLLPKPEKSDEAEASAEDMAGRLAFRLKRLDAMRVAGQALQDGPVAGNVVFLRGMPEQPKVIKHTEYDTTVYHLTQAFGAIRKRREEARPHRVEKQLVLPLEAARQSLKSVIPDLEDWETLDAIRLKVVQPGTDLPERSIAASMFSAALELARDGDVDMRQSAHFEPIYLKSKLQETGRGATP